MNKLFVFTDGASTMSKVNGEYCRGRGGAAIAIIENENIIYEDSVGFSKTTNNFCELYAILMALKYCSTHYQDRFIDILSDSAYCVNMLKKDGWVYGWERNNWKRKGNKPIENLEIIKEIYSYIKNNNRIEFVKVKGHTGENDWNDYVDKLAVKAKKEKIGVTIE